MKLHELLKVQEKVKELETVPLEIAYKDIASSGKLVPKPTNTPIIEVAIPNSIDIDIALSTINFDPNTTTAIPIPNPRKDPINGTNLNLTFDVSTVVFLSLKNT